jgi:hypothetical protein
MDHNRLEIPCPAQIKLDSPNAFIFGLIKGRNGIFKYPLIIVMPPMGNDSALLKVFYAGNGLRPPGIKIVQDLSQMGL